MSDDHLFALASAVPLVGWLALAFAPLRRAAAVIVARVVAVVLAAGYLALVGAALAHPAGPAPDFQSLAGLAKAFSNPHVMLIGWVHYLALDLWTGSWEVEEAGRRGVPHAAVLPCLLLTFLAGPAGLVVFLILRSILGRRGAPPAPS